MRRGEDQPSVFYPALAWLPGSVRRGGGRAGVGRSSVPSQEISIEVLVVLPSGDQASPPTHTSYTSVQPVLWGDTRHETRDIYTNNNSRYSIILRQYFINNMLALHLHSTLHTAQ